MTDEIPRMFELGDASTERLNDVDFYLRQLVDKFADPKDTFAAAQMLEHHEYVVEFAHTTAEPVSSNLYHNRNRRKPFMYLRNAGGQFEAVSTTQRRVVRLTRDKSSVDSWTITEAFAFEGYHQPSYSVVDVLGRYMEMEYEKEWEKTDRPLPAIASMLVYLDQARAAIADSDIADPLYKAVDVLHRIQRERTGRYGSRSHMRFHLNRGTVEVVT